MSTNHEIAACCAILCGGAMIIAASRQQKRRKKRRWWCTELYKKRTGQGLLTDLSFQHVSGHYKNFTRMTPSDFENILQKIGPAISKNETYMRQPISAQDRLAVTLRFLATGDSYTSLQYLFRISKQSISKIIPEVCLALVEELKDYIKLPSTPRGWLEVADVFENIWNLPHCIGALDGKHVTLQAPINSSSDFFNYKSQFSIVLMAVVDGNYNFLYADVGCQGRISDGGVFKDTSFYKMMKNNMLQLPLAKELPGRKIKVPYFLAADGAFALMENIMKPYAGDHPAGSLKRIFNYRISRARRIVENVFGILSSVFRILRKPMLLEPKKAEVVVSAIIYLHNYLRKHSPNIYTPQLSLDHDECGAEIPGLWRNDDNPTSMIPLRSIPRRPPAHVMKFRDEIADYCMKEGAVPWQTSYA